MSRPVTEPFAEEHLDAAGELLAARHRRNRRAEPLLSQRFEDPLVARAEVEALWRADDTPGAVVIRDGRVAGYMVGIRKAELWGANVWVDPAGHAAEEPELVRDLYAAAAAEWVAAGLKAHYAVAPAVDARFLESWYRLGFGQQQAYAIREVPEEGSWPEGTRPMRREDFDDLIRLGPMLGEHQAAAPVFSRGPDPGDEEELRRELEEDLGNDEVASLVAEQEGRVVANFYLAPIEYSSTHGSVTRCDGSLLLGFAISDPQVRGRGAGLKLMAASFAWAREHGYDTITTDWRVTNLLSSRFWTARGFRPTFFRLHRLIA